MRKQTRSILQELSNLAINKDNDLLIESTANNIINSSINLINLIYENYNENDAAELEKRFINSVRTGDPNKFKRGIQRIIESKRNKNAP
tara:strand:- start:177 stop:443 length:267 start_codon:yes stop_codon:yes gene_type:complete